MRVPSFPTILRTLYTLTNTTGRSVPQHRALQPFVRGTILKSMPIFSFASLFGTNSSAKMSYPVQKSNDEWQAVLSKGNEGHYVQSS